MQDLSESLRFLGDQTRLRILRLLAEAPLNVTELVHVLGAAQSNVSHHLAKLKKHGLVVEERHGSAKVYSLAQGASADSPGELWPLIKLAVEWQDDDAGDLSRLRDLIREREDRQALNERLLEPGQSWFLWSRALGALLPPIDVADFGCGSGILSLEIARWARSVIAIDSSAQALAKARARAEAAELGRRIRFQRDDLQALSLKNHSLDLVVVSQSLHHVEAPEKVVAEAARVLRPGGSIVLIELFPHSEEWVRARLGHRSLGIDPADVKSWLRTAGFSSIMFDDSIPRGSGAFRPFLFTARTEEEL